MRIEDCIHFCAPSRLVIELGYRHKLPRLLQTLGYRRGVLVTDAFFAHKTPWVSDYVAACARLGIHVDVYAAGAPDPTTDLCDRASAELRGMLGTQLPDHVVSLGGGSASDAKPQTVADAIRPVGAAQIDRTLMIPMRYSPGFMLGQNPVGLYGLNTGEAFGHLGFLTVLCWADPARDISVALLNTGKSMAPAMITRLLRVLYTIGKDCERVR